MESLEDIIRFEEQAILRKPFTLEGHDDKIKIYPLTIGQMIEINPYLIAIQKEDELDKLSKISDEGSFNEALKYTQKYLPIFMNIIEIVIGKGNAKELTPDEVLITFVALIKRIQVKSFLKSIIQATGMSLNRKEEIIASESTIGKD